MRQLCMLGYGLLLIGSLALSNSCATHKPLVAPPVPASQPTSGDRGELPALDSTIVAREPSLLDKLLGRTPKPFTVPVDVAHRAPDIGNGLPRKCKGCTFNVVAGNQTVAGKKAQVAAGTGAVASVVEKKAGPSIVASDSSIQNTVLGGGNIQATNGNNNTPTLTASVQPPPDWRATLAKPVGYALATVGTVVLVGGVIFLFAAYRRRQKLQA